MEENQFKNAPRKIRKIKRPRAPENQPATYGVPEKFLYRKIACKTKPPKIITITTAMPRISILSQMKS